MNIDLYATAREQVAWLSSGKVSSIELLEAYIVRFEEVNPKLNAVIATNFNYARETARSIDQRRKQGEDVGPLCGLPMTVKDVFDMAELPAVCGDPNLVGRDSNVDDAVVIQHLKAAGAVIWGKTNTPIYAGDVQTYNKVYGITNNPYDQSRTPGGSSGGSAAALAAGLAPLEVGSDIGGSLRNPAHNCGICALKPTWGKVSTNGHIPPLPEHKTDVEVDLGVAGPMARNIEDLELLLSIIAPDGKEAAESVEFSDLKIANWKEPNFALSDEIAQSIKLVVGRAKEEGATVEDAKPDFNAQDLVSDYQKLLIPIISSGMPKLVIYIMKLLRPIAKMFAKYGDISLSNTILAATQSDDDFAQAQKRRNALKKECDIFFKEYDVLISPVIAVEAIPHNTKGSLYSRSIDVDGKPRNYTCLLEWISLSSHCHLPAAVVPVGATDNGLPLGVQIIGAEGADQKVLNVARLFEQTFDGPKPPQL